MTNSFTKRTSNLDRSGEKITATRIQKIKKQAKDLSSRGSISHMEALDLVCATEGLGNWESVIRLTAPGIEKIAAVSAPPQKPIPQQKPISQDPQEKTKDAELYEAFSAEHIETFEPRDNHFRITRIGSAYFSLCVSYDEITLCSIEPSSVNKRTIRIIDSVALGPCQIDRPSEKDLPLKAYMATGYGQQPSGGLWICKYEPRQPQIWIGNLPGDLGLIALQRELGVGFGLFVRRESRFLYDNTTKQTGFCIGDTKKTAFESSSAYLDLMKWAKKHPKKAKEQSLRDRYMKDWYGKAKELGFL